MNESNSVHARIRSFVTGKFPAARKRAITDDTPLLDSGIVDSLGMLEVVTFLEQTFKISISDDELTPEHFESIQRLASFVEKKSATEVTAE